MPAVVSTRTALGQILCSAAAVSRQQCQRRKGACVDPGATHMCVTGRDSRLQSLAWHHRIYINRPRRAAGRWCTVRLGRLGPL